MYKSLLYLPALSHLNFNCLEFCQKLVKTVVVYKIVQNHYGCESSVSLYVRLQLPLHLNLYLGILIYFYPVYGGYPYTGSVDTVPINFFTPLKENKFFGS